MSAMRRARTNCEEILQLLDGFLDDGILHDTWSRLEATSSIARVVRKSSRFVAYCARSGVPRFKMP